MDMHKNTDISLKIAHFDFKIQILVQYYADRILRTNRTIEVFRGLVACSVSLILENKEIY